MSWSVAVAVCPMVKLNTLHGYNRAAAAELIKVKKYFFTSRESPGITLKTELLFSLLQPFHFARSGRQSLY